MKKCWYTDQNHNLVRKMVNKLLPSVFLKAFLFNNQGSVKHIFVKFVTFCRVNGLSLETNNLFMKVYESFGKNIITTCRMKTLLA